MRQSDATIWMTIQSKIFCNLSRFLSSLYLLRVRSKCSQMIQFSANSRDTINHNNHVYSADYLSLCPFAFCPMQIYQKCAQFLHIFARLCIIFFFSCTFAVTFIWDVSRFSSCVIFLFVKNQVKPGISLFYSKENVGATEELQTNEIIISTCMKDA